MKKVVAFVVVAFVIAVGVSVGYTSTPSAEWLPPSGSLNTTTV